jgi:hypothetical protein
MKKITFIFALLIVSTVMKAQQTAWVNCKGITANRSFGVKFDSSGNVIQVGSFRGTIDFNNLGPTPVDRVSNGLSDIYVAKYNPSGILLWVYTIGGTGDDIANAIAIDSNGDIVVTGAFSDSFDFNAGTNSTTLTSSGSTDAFVLKLTSAGAFSWAQRAGGVEAEGGSDIETIGTNIFVSGTYASGIVDLFSNTNSICRGVNDVFLCAFSSNGSYLWSKTMGNAFNDATGRLTAFNNKIALCFSSFGNSSISTFDYGGTAQASVTTSTGGAITTGLGRNGAVSIFDSVTGSFDKFFQLIIKYNLTNYIDPFNNDWSDYQNKIIYQLIQKDPNYIYKMMEMEFSDITEIDGKYYVDLEDSGELAQFFSSGRNDISEGRIAEILNGDYDGYLYDDVTGDEFKDIYEELEPKYQEEIRGYIKEDLLKIGNLTIVVIL